MNNAAAVPHDSLKKSESQKFGKLVKTLTPKRQGLGLGKKQEKYGLSAFPASAPAAAGRRFRCVPPQTLEKRVNILCWL